MRHYLIALPYLLGCVTDLRPLGNYKRVAMAEKVFAPARITDLITRVAGCRSAFPPGSSHVASTYSADRLVVFPPGNRVTREARPDRIR